MSIAFANDLHLTSHTPKGRIDDVLATSIAKITEILAYCQRLQLILVIAGDLCERARDWYLLPHLIAALAYYNVPVYAVFGQHDYYQRNEEGLDATTLGVLVSAGLVTLLGQVPIIYQRDPAERVWALYGCGWGLPVPVPDPDMPYTNPNASNILVIHHPLAVEPVWAGHHHTDIYQFMEQHPEYMIFACGDVHRQFLIGHNNQVAINTGPILRIDADEYNMQHMPAIAVLDERSMTINWYPLKSALRGPEVLTRQHIEEKHVHDEKLAAFVDMVKRPRNTRGMPMIERVRAWIGENKGTADATLINLLETTTGLKVQA